MGGEAMRADPQLRTFQRAGQGSPALFLKTCNRSLEVCYRLQPLGHSADWNQEEPALKGRDKPQRLCSAGPQQHRPTAPGPLGLQQECRLSCQKTLRLCVTLTCVDASDDVSLLEWGCLGPTAPLPTPTPERSDPAWGLGSSWPKENRRRCRAVPAFPTLHNPASHHSLSHPSRNPTALPLRWNSHTPSSPAKPPPTAGPTLSSASGLSPLKGL